MERSRYSLGFRLACVFVLGVFSFSELTFSAGTEFTYLSLISISHSSSLQGWNRPKALLKQIKEELVNFFFPCCYAQEIAHLSSQKPILSIYHPSLSWTNPQKYLNLSSSPESQLFSSPAQPRQQGTTADTVMEELADTVFPVNDTVMIRLFDEKLPDNPAFPLTPLSNQPAQKPPFWPAPDQLMPAEPHPKLFLSGSEVGLKPNLYQRPAKLAYSISEPMPELEPYKLPFSHAPPLTPQYTCQVYNCAFLAISLLLPSVNPLNLLKDLSLYTDLNNQTSLLGLKEVSNKYGLTLYPLKIAPSQLSQLISSSSLLIIHLQREDNLGHYILAKQILKIQDNLVTYVDIEAGTLNTGSFLGYILTAEEPQPFFCSLLSQEELASIKGGKAEAKDILAPIGTIKLNNNQTYTSSSWVTLTLFAKDTGSGLNQMQFSNDNISWSKPEVYSTRKRWNLSPGDGEKRVYVKFQDKAGNWSSAYSASIILDTTPPSQPVVKDEGATSISTQQLSASWTSSDLVSGIAEYQYQIRQDSPKGIILVRWTSVGSLSSITKTDISLKLSKTYYIAVKAKNKAGLWSETGYSDGIKIIIDTTPPTGTIKINNASSGYTNSNQVIFTLLATDAESGLNQMQFSTDQKTWSGPEDYSTSKTITFSSPDGKKTISVRFSDKAGNWSEAVSCTIILDTTPPTPPQVSIQRLNPTHQILFSFQADELGSGIAGYYYCLAKDKQANQLILAWTFTQQTTIELNDLNLTEGTYYILVKAKDLSGNESEIGLSELIRVYPPVITPPTTSCLQAQLDEPTYQEPVLSSAANPAISSLSTILNNFQVDPLIGSSNLSIPLEVPPGRQELKPNLSLVYCSSLANSYLGLGWGLSGLGSIERSSKKGLANYDASDSFIFSLAGISGELVNLGNHQYRAKQESGFLKFLFNPQENFWEVTDKSGIRYLFGLTSNSRQDLEPLGSFTWQIERIIDLSGNYIQFFYQKDQNQIYPERIYYTANALTEEPGFAQVCFILEPRPDPQTSYRSGKAITTAKRLASIQTYFQAQLVRQFNLGYTQEPITQQSLLSCFTVYGSDQTSLLPPYIFTYTQNNSNSNSHSSSPLQGITLTKAFSPNAFSPLTADFNADTKTDIGVIDQQGNFLIALSEGEDFLTPATYLTGYKPANNRRLSLGDFNGDTKTDIAFVPSGKADWTSTSGGNHAGDDWTLTQQEVIAGLHTGIDRFIIPQGITAYVAGWLEIHATTIEISGTLCADGTGYAGGSGCKSGNQPGLPGTGPGKGNSAGTYSGGGGGAYAGKGGDNIHWGKVDATGGSSYGNASDWGIQPGSGGGGGGGDTGNGGTGGNGGNGGGCIKLLGCLINISGTVSANGLSGENGQHRAGGGGGSGGGILIFANDLRLNGILQAKGGDGGGSGGGIVISANDLILTHQLQAKGGNGGGGGPSSGAGAGSGGRIKVFWHNSLEGTISHQENGGSGGDGPAGRGGNGEDGSFYSAQTEQAVTDELNLKVILLQGDSFARPSCWLEQDKLPADIASVLSGDFNADGLIDLCFLSSSNGSYTYYVSISEGTKFLAPELWLSNDTFANTTNCQTLSADFNADGLTDLACFNKDTGICQISLSEGRRFITPYSLSLNPASGKELSCYDINSDGKQDLGFLSDASKGEWQFVLSQGTNFNLSAFTYKTNLNSQQQLADFNGDSLPDSFSFDQSNGTYQLCLAPEPQERRPHLLLYEVQNGIGGSISIKYKPSNSSEEDTTNSQDYHLPFAFWIVERVSLNDGLGNSLQTNYQYQQPYFSYSQREFRGFAYSKVTDAQGNTVENYFLQDELYKGKLYKQETKDKQGNLYTRQEYTYQDKELYPGVSFVYLAQVDKFTYDGDASFKQTRTKYIYDDYGNLTQTIFEGDLSISGDEKTSFMEYIYNPNLWLLSLPKHSFTQDAQNNKVAEKWFYYDYQDSPDAPPTKGLLTKQESWLYNPLTLTQERLPLSYSYDTYGNLTSTTDALGRTTTTSYDELLHIYPVKTSNCLGHTLIKTYDPQTGNLLSSTDPNGQTTSNRYDSLGRLIKVIGPDDREELPALSYEYDLPSNPDPFTTPPSNPDPFTKLLLDFEENSFTDATGKGISVWGNPQIDTSTSKSGRASAYFDGKEDYLCLADSDDWNLGNQDFTIDFWVKFDSFPSYLSNIITQYDPYHYVRFYYANHDGRLKFVVYDGSEIIAFCSSKASLSLNTWYHIALVRSGTSAADWFYFLNGIKLPGAWWEKGDGDEILPDLSGRLEIGRSAQPENELYLNGWLDELRISKGIALWTSNFTPPQDKKEVFRITKKVKQNQKGDYLTTYSFYDGLGRLIQAKSPADNDPKTNQPRQIVSARISFDPLGRVKQAWTNYFTNEVNDKLDTQDLLSLAKFSFTYDPLGRLIQTTHPDGTTSSLLYSDGQVTYLEGTVPNDEGTVPQKTTHFFDAQGRIIKVQEYNQGQVYTTTYAYDTLGNLTRLTDNQGNTTQLFYDSSGRKLKMQDPDMGIWSYDYDQLGNLIRQTDAKGQILTFRYDALNRLIEKGTELATVYSLLAAYFYDAPSKDYCIGRLSKVIDQSGSTEFFYDHLGREIKSIKTIAGTGTVPNDEATALNTYTVQREYDPLDRLTKLIYPDGTTLQYQYNAQGLERVTDITQPLNPFDYIQKMSYSSSGHSLQIDYGNNTTTYYRYQPNSSKLLLIATLNQKENQTLQELYYQYDSSGNITQIEDKVNQTTQSFIYDNLNRLIQSARQEAGTVPNTGETERGTIPNTLNYTYDSLGNLLEKEGITYQYGERPHAPTQVGETILSYDANGNLIQKQNLTQGNNTTYTYDPENRLTEVQQDGIITSFTYDGDGGRVTKKVIGTVPNDDQQTNQLANQQTIYIGSLFEIKTDYTDSKDQITQIKKHIFAGSTRVCTITTSNLEPTTYNQCYYHPDHLGSSDVITDQTGQAIQHLTYQPYGQVCKIEGTQVTDHLFTGKEQDNSGLYYYGARFYDPEIGRFISADPTIQRPYDPQDLNRYSYCRNNPINLIDPSGLGWFKKLCEKAGSYFGLVGNFINACNSGNWEQFGREALITVVAVAANILLPGAGTFSSNLFINIGFHILRGACIGAVTGGISSEIMGGSFAEGAKLGAISGAIFGSIQGVTTSEQFINWKAGNGFRSNRDIRTAEYLQKREALRVESQKRGDFVEKKIYARRLQDSSGNLKTGGPRHLAAEDPWEMGPVQRGPNKGLIATSDSIDDLSNWRTHIATQKAISSGQVLEGTTRVSEWGWAESGKLYNEYWVSQPYMATNQNSNFAIDSRVYGAGGDLPEGLGWHPEFR